MLVPAALAAIPLTAGAAAGILLAERAGPDVAMSAGAAACLALISAAAWIGHETVCEAACAIVLCAALAGLSLGFSAARQAYRPPLLAWFEGERPHAAAAPVVLHGILLEDAALTDYGASLVVDVRYVAQGAERTRCRGGVRLGIGGTGAPALVGEWRAGRSIRVPATLRIPTTYRNPGLPDERRGLARRGIVLVGSVKSASLVEVVARGGFLREAAASARAWCRRALTAHVARHSARSGAIGTAILIGDRSGLDDEDERRLQDAGTYHVIAISGGNIAILTVTLLAMLRILLVPGRVASGIVIVILVFYALLTGAPSSVTRAVSAAVVYLAGRMLDHRGPPLNALGVAAIFSVAIWPLAALDAGFILSFGATLGILVGTGPLLETTRGPIERGQPRAFVRILATAAAGLLAASLCAEAVLLPAAASLFGRVTAAGLIVNFAAIPLMTVTQLASLLTLALFTVSARGAEVAGFVAHLAAVGLIESARFVDFAPWLSSDVARPGWIVVLAYYASLLAVLLGIRRGQSSVALCAAVACIATGPAFAARDVRPPRPGHLRVVFLDVGQGDATLVTLPGGPSLLVDAGGIPGSSFDIADRVLVPALRALAVRRLDELVITHGDPDHLGGALGVARRFHPRVVREGVPVPEHAGLAALQAFVTGRGGTWRTVQAGDVDRMGHVRIAVLHPPLPDWERRRVRNDDSVVLELRYGDVSIVLPGDIGRQPELDILPRLSPAPLVVLKAPHHGSLTSSTPEFLAAAKPAAVIFSAGRASRFNHPAPAVVARYTAIGAHLFGTPEDGAVIVETDGRVVDIRTVSGRTVRLQVGTR